MTGQLVVPRGAAVLILSIVATSCLAVMAPRVGLAIQIRRP